MKIIVCDDIASRGRESVYNIERATQGNADVRSLFADELANVLRDLFGFVRHTMPGDRTVNFNDLERWDCDALDADILVVDNNLGALQLQGSRITAEDIVGYIRAFSQASYIVSLNKNPEVDFDLRYLVGDYQTHADMALNTDHLANRALWTGIPGDSDDQFIPWYWPALNDAPARRKSQISFVTERLESSILSTFSMPDGCASFFSRHARGALSGSISSGEQGVEDEELLNRITFLAFFAESCRSIPIIDERKAIIEVIADNPNFLRRVIAQVVASELEKWLRRDVIGPQDVLVDIPNLLMRMPFLLGNRGGVLDSWNDAVTSKGAPFGLDDAMYNEFLRDAQFELDIWTKSTCFWWPLLKSNESLNEFFFRPDNDWLDALFCEDLSAFVDSNSVGRNILEFASEFENSSWNRRNVAELEGKNYVPRSRFAT